VTAELSALVAHRATLQERGSVTRSTSAPDGAMECSNGYRA